MGPGQSAFGVCVLERPGRDRLIALYGPQEELHLRASEPALANVMRAKAVGLERKRIKAFLQRVGRGWVSVDVCHPQDPACPLPVAPHTARERCGLTMPTTSRPFFGRSRAIALRGSSAFLIVMRPLFISLIPSRGRPCHSPKIDRHARGKGGGSLTDAIAFRGAGGGSWGGGGGCRGR